MVKHSLNHMPKQPHMALLFCMVFVIFFVTTVQGSPTSNLGPAAQWRSAKEREKTIRCLSTLSARGAGAAVPFAGA